MNAVIYCRVSSRDQVEGTSLESQESACREYARRHNLSISRIFVEEGESAKFADRTQLLELLSYCKDRKRGVEVLLVWKVDRFARNVEDHYTIKAALRKLGVRIASVTEPIEADPNGKLMETILAGFAQFDNDIRALRTIQGMQQRLREGIWPWKPPLGYLPPKIGKKTSPDTPDPLRFEPIQKAWQFFATGAYSKADIVRLLQTWGVCAYWGRPVSAQTLDHMFANPYYAGVLRNPWTEDEYAGRHVAMVSQSEFARVQEIVAGSQSQQRPHHHVSEDFPLRSLVRCPSCEHVMTGYFAKGQRRRYPYYKCFRHACPTRSRSYPTSEVHDEFSGMLAATSLTPSVATGLISEILAAHSEHTAQARLSVKRRQEEFQGLKNRLQELVSMRTARMVSDDEFILQRDRIRKRMSAIQASHISESDRLEAEDISALTECLSDLDLAWKAIPVTAKRGFGEMVLPAGYVFRRVRTAQKGLLFKLTDASEGGESNVVDNKRF